MSLELLNEVDDILQVPIAGHGGEGRIGWHFTASGNYTVKIGYWLAHTMGNVVNIGNPRDSNSLWRWTIVWKMLVPSKVKLFFWRTFSTALPCALSLFRRNIKSDTVCNLCERANELVFHGLCSCENPLLI